ncbi:MAG: polysaccharide deacetylase family protein [Chloroflexi bacterium]|nr:polysaccharide deacetylase family protein [Chloroflexota bacterium]
MTKVPALSVVIPTYNRRPLLERTLPTLVGQDCPVPFEIVVAVDGSPDDTAEYLGTLSWPKWPSIRILPLEHRGQAATCNAGAATAKGQLLLFLDDDMMCHPRLVARHLRAHRALGAGVVVLGALLLHPETPISLASRWIKTQTEDYFQSLTGPCWIEDVRDRAVGPNTSLDRASFLEHGGYDERFSSGLDHELAVRLSASGAKFRYIPDAAASQLFTKSTARFLLTDAHEWGACELRLCRKHPSLRASSMLASVAHGSPIHITLRRLFLTLPSALVTSVVSVLAKAERLFLARPLRSASLHVFGQLHALMMIRGAGAEAGSARALAGEFGRRLPILMYHHVGSPMAGADPSLTVHPRRFHRHLRLMKRLGYSTILSHDWRTWLRTGRGLPRRPVLITFDDGYRDVVRYALPALSRESMTAEAFLVSNHLGGTNAWDAAAGWATRPLVSADEGRAWLAAGMAIGSHSRRHPDLTRVSASELHAEVNGSRTELERIFGEAVATFAYPHGLWNESVQAEVGATYDLALSSEEGMNSLATPTTLLRRTMVCPRDGAVALLLKLWFGTNVLARIRDLAFARGSGILRVFRPRQSRSQL